MKNLIVLTATNEGTIYDEIDNENKIPMEKLSFDVFIYDENFAMKEFFKIYIDCERFYYSQIYDVYSIYSYTNNFLFIFIGNNIFQLCLKQKEITTIYEMFPIPIRERSSFKENFKVIKFNYPNGDSIKELILLNYCELNIVYVYEIVDMELKFLKVFNFSKFSDFIEFNIFEMSNDLIKFPNDLEKIIINSNSIRTLK